jgi:hypothetical protein
MVCRIMLVAVVAMNASTLLTARSSGRWSRG